MSQVYAKSYDQLLDGEVRNTSFIRSKKTRSFIACLLSQTIGDGVGFDIGTMRQDDNTQTMAVPLPLPTLDALFMCQAPAQLRVDTETLLSDPETQPRDSDPSSRSASGPSEVTSHSESELMSGNIYNFSPRT